MEVLRALLLVAGVMALGHLRSFKDVLADGMGMAREVGHGDPVYSCSMFQTLGSPAIVGREAMSCKN